MHSTHILDEAERIANRAVILNQGKILVDSTPTELMGQASERNRIEVHLESSAPEELVDAIRGSDWCDELVAQDARLEIRPRGAERPLGDLLTLLADHNCTVVDLRVSEGRLDDLFREITKGVAA